MNVVRTILESTVPISQFNRGLAGKIFDEVKKYGAKIVMKNNEPECVLLSPEDYIALIDQVNDAKLLLLAMKEWKNMMQTNLYHMKML